MNAGRGRGEHRGIPRVHRDCSCGGTWRSHSDAAQLRRELTADEDPCLESVGAEAWERLALAALVFDDVLPDPESPTAERMQVDASLHAPLEAGWHLSPCRGEDGVTYPRVLVGRTRTARPLC
jgi:hypothetical protein